MIRPLTHADIDPVVSTARGIPFDSLEDLPAFEQAYFVSRGFVFATEFLVDGERWGGTILAPTWGMAEALAAERGLGEVVVGEMMAVHAVRPGRVMS